MAILNKKQSIGIDIADRSIEVVLLSAEKGIPEFKGKGRVILPAGIVEKGRIMDGEKLFSALEEAAKGAGVTSMQNASVVFGVPESHVYTHISEVAVKDATMLASRLEEELAQSIPIARQNMYPMYKVIATSSNVHEVLFVAANKEVVDEWVNFFESHEITVRVFDIEPMALMRGLFPAYPAHPVCIVDMGARTTSVSIFEGSVLTHSHTLFYAGDFLTEELANLLAVSSSEAEKIKKEKGVSNTEDRSFLILVAGLEKIAREIKSTVAFFENKKGRKVQEIIFVGGGAELSGLVEYMNENLDTQVRLGSSRIIKEKSPLLYVEALGLALRAGNPERFKNDLFIPRSKEEEEKATMLPMDTFKANLFVAKVRLASNFLLGFGHNLIQKHPHSRPILIFLGAAIIGALGVGAYFLVFNKDTTLSQENQDVVDVVIEQEVPIIPDRDPEEELQDGAPVGSDVTAGVAKSETVTILETPTGWLNLREGPGTEYARAGRVFPGESYPLIEKTEDGEWYKIKSEAVEAWIFAIYASTSP